MSPDEVIAMADAASAAVPPLSQDAADLCAALLAAHRDLAAAS